MTAAIFSAADAHARLEEAARWLDDRGRATTVVVVGATRTAAVEAIRRSVARRGAVFGWRATTLAGWATELAEVPLAADGFSPAAGIATDAVAVRVIHGLTPKDLGRFEAVAGSPGFHRALGRTLAELRLAGVDPGDVARIDPDLGTLARAYQERLEADGLADLAVTLRRAAVLARDGGADHPLLGAPLLLLDVPLPTEMEAAFVAAVAAPSPMVLATAPAGDGATARRLEAALGVAAVRLPGGSATALARLQRCVFRDDDPPAGSMDPTVTLMSAPGEGREAVEIARRILGLAGQDVPFDRMAILLRSPDAYRAHLEDALGRAGIPAHFARGVFRPDPGGRAIMALLRCAAEGLSAARFAEYLSLGVVPDPEAGGAIIDGALRVPRRWERLLVESAVVGGRERWSRRLDGLAQQLHLQLQARTRDDPDDPAVARIRRDMADLEHLASFALPLLDDLAALPRAAPWAEWLVALTALARRAVADPAHVLTVLAELQPMSPVGPVGLPEVTVVLAEHLLALTRPAAAARYGKVFVAPVDAARGLAFDVVFLPGLAEKLMPRKISEDPILLDAARRRLDGALATNADRVADERLAFMVAAGAARRALVLSYPRLDADKARPRVPSFYALEALRAAEGRLPLLDDMVRRADDVAEARVGWPAPASRDGAIDEAEYDLAVLETLRARDPAERKGAARYLLLANPHLARALRFRARRWQVAGWTPADGLVKPSAEAEAALAAHRLDARSYSPTALQNFALCPYRFFLYAMHRLAPREEAAGIEVMDPLQRGSLVHDVQFETLSLLRDAGLLPVTADNLEEARGHLDAALDAVARRYRDDLAPAIDRVWDDGVDDVKADLREWLRRAAEDPSGFVPWRFELTFGLPPWRPRRDPHSVDEAVDLDCGLTLRGSVDLVERNAAGELRITDHKTGRARVKPEAVIDGGRALQPVFYALAVEKVFAPATVAAGRLYYCTSTGNFEERIVPLDRRARAAARTVAEAVGSSLEEGFLPAAPAEGACRWCDYQVVCGPHEERRTARKRGDDLAALVRLRQVP